MKIRLFLAITFILFSMTSGIEVLGMKETYDDDSFAYEIEYKKKMMMLNHWMKIISIVLKIMVLEK